MLSTVAALTLGGKWKINDKDSSLFTPRKDIYDEEDFQNWREFLN